MAEVKIRITMLTGQMEYPWTWRWTVGGKTFRQEKDAEEHARLLTVLEESLDEVL